VHELLPFIITGLVSGMIYGLAGTGFTLTYKTSGILNFGHGAILTTSALLYYALHVSAKWPWELAALIAFVIAGPGLGFVMELLARSISRQRTALKVVGTIGLSVLVPAICLIFYPRANDTLQVKRFLPFSNHAHYKWRIFNVNVFGDQLITAIVAVVATALLYVLFRFTRLGSEMRAAVDDPDLLDLTGVSPARVRRISWVIGCSFAAVSGLLILPLVGLQPYNLTFLAMYAFGAAAIGSFSSIPITFVGGLIVGVAQSLVTHEVNKYHWEGLSGLPDALPFVILFIVLIVLPKDRLSARTGAEVRPQIPWRGPLELRLGVGVIVVVVLSLVPSFAGHNLSYFSYGLAQGTLMLSLGLLVRTSEIGRAHV
jgi:branched-subunit amino acid ABC-type transport system permease component